MQIVFAHVCVRANKSTSVHVHVYVRVCTYGHTLSSMRLHGLTYKHARARVCIHTHMRASECLRSVHTRE
jgi:hypothetical protein